MDYMGLLRQVFIEPDVEQPHSILRVLSILVLASSAFDPDVQRSIGKDRIKVDHVNILSFTESPYLASVFHV